MGVSCESGNVPEYVVSAAGLSKTYRNGIQALKGIALSVKQGEIFCLLGPNGAGKTTTLRIFSTQLEPDKGDVWILGFNLRTKRKCIRKRIACVPQEAMPDPELTAWDHVFYYLFARGLSVLEARKRARWALEAAQLWDHRNTPTAQLSGGMRKRVLVAMVIATRASLIFLDEPSAGLDPLSRRALWQVLYELKGESSIFLTTHAMDEAEAISDMIAVLYQGRVLAVGTPRELKEQVLVSGDHKLVLEGPLPPGCEELGRVEAYGGKTIIYPKDEGAIQMLVEHSLKAGVRVARQPVTLEDAFIYLVSEAGA